MKERTLKVIVAIILAIALTISNWAILGMEIISYALDVINATNQENVQFEAYFKDAEGNKLTTLERNINEKELSLYLKVSVVKEGYFSGKISLGNSNFVLKSSNSEYVNKVENNTIYLNPINVGSTDEIEVKIEPIYQELFKVDLLNNISEINLQGTYKNSTEKDIEIKATRNLTLKLKEDNTVDNVVNEMQIITNKVLKVGETNKRVIQISYDMGLKENNYPIKEITSKIAIPTINEKQAELVTIAYINNMSKFEYNYDGSNLEIKLKNETNSEGKINFKSEGTENTIITLIYDEDTVIENEQITANQKLTLYNNKALEMQSTVSLVTDELDNVIQVNGRNSEAKIYKGKIYSGIARQYQSLTELKINYAGAISNIELAEEQSRYAIGQEELQANVFYNKTTVSKEKFDKLFGENGVITVYDQNGTLIGTITAETEANEDGNIVLSYDGLNVTQITIKTNNPIKEGTLRFIHTKTIQEVKDTVSRDASELRNKISTKYDTDVKQEKEIAIKLENTITQADIEINKDLSTVVSNNVEMKVVLTASDESYDLFKNPQITIELPEQVENITINSIDLLYENELSITNYEVNGRIINIFLTGEQTQYHEDSTGGATIFINATINVNKKSPTCDGQMKMTYINQKDVIYPSGETGIVAKLIKIKAPKELTTVYSISGLGVETIGQEEQTQVEVEKGTEAKDLQAQIEVINNNQNSIENVKILGDLPTNNDSNNMGIQLTSGISMQDANARVYYSENTNATDDLENPENAWQETYTDASKVSKYLIVADKIDSQSSLQGSFTYSLPANLEWNQVAKTSYSVKNINSATQKETILNSTAIALTTGQGPEITTELSASVGGQELEEGAEVKNGEVIKYTITVTNTGAQDIDNLTVTGQVPQGTKLVVPEAGYEHTSNHYWVESDSTEYNDTIDNISIGESRTIEYNVRVKKDCITGTQITNTIQINSNNHDIFKTERTPSFVSTDGKIMVSIKRMTLKEIDLYTNDQVKYYAIIENTSDEDIKHVKVTSNFSNCLQIAKLNIFTYVPEEENEFRIY